jgi:HlyD family secretion protein
VAQKAAVLNTAQVNLDNTIISSPVEGVVIGRDVDVGQTVAASLQAPTLFTIAQDLRQMQVETSIDEADIGQIVPGQQAVFTVDSFPGQEFRGVVTQVRKQATEVQSVITYTVIIAAENPELKLLPGMTASVDIRVSNRTNVLKVPSAALRFRPPDAEAALQASATLPEGQGGGKGGGKGAFNADAQREQLDRLAALLQLDEEQKAKVAAIEKEVLANARAQRQSGQPANRDQRQKSREQADREIMEVLRPDQQTKFKALLAERRDNPAAPARVWVLENGKPKAVPIFIGVNDNSASELVRGNLKEGEEVLVGINRGEGGRAQGKAFRFGF